MGIRDEDKFPYPGLVVAASNEIWSDILCVGDFSIHSVNDSTVSTTQVAVEILSSASIINQFNGAQCSTHRYSV